MIDFPPYVAAKVPSDVREEDLWPVFQPFGTVRNLHLLKGSDGKPRGCAMVLFQRWAHAEAAAEALDGQLVLETGGQRKPLVVHFANPRRAPPGQPAEPGIAPRKLFVGQVRPASVDPGVSVRPCRGFSQAHERSSPAFWLCLVLYTLVAVQDWEREVCTCFSVPYLCLASAELCHCCTSR